MRAAFEQSKRLADKDDVAAGLSLYLSKHIKEEMHHDDWLLDDLEILGYKRQNLLQLPPTTTIASLTGAQYYWIYHYHPVCLLGYIAVMEGYPSTTAQIQEMQRRTGHPSEAFRTLIKHANLDPHHRDDLDEVLDQLPITKKQQQLISVNAMFTVKHCAQALLEILEQEPFRKKSIGV